MTPGTKLAKGPDLGSGICGFESRFGEKRKFKSLGGGTGRHAGLRSPCRKA